MSCQKKVIALKGLRIYKLPKVLTLQLKRFEFDWKTESRRKVNDRLRFPFYLDLSDIVLKDITLEQAKSNQKLFQQQSLDNSNDSSSNSVGGSFKAESSKSQWSCALCTFTNDSSYVMCEMCFTPRPPEAIQKPEVTPAPPAPTSSTPASTGSQDTEKPKDTEDSQKQIQEKQQQEEEENEEEEYEEEEERPVITEANSGKVYELYSVLVHSGSAMGGHYYVYVKSLSSDKWFNFNDQNVSFLSQHQVRETFGEKVAKSAAAATASSNPDSNGETKPDLTPNKRPSKWTTGANAYVLMYRRMDLNSNLNIEKDAKVIEEEENKTEQKQGKEGKTETKVEDGMLRLGKDQIPKGLKNEIEEENREYVEEKEKMGSKDKYYESKDLF